MQGSSKLESCYTGGQSDYKAGMITLIREAVCQYQILLYDKQTHRSAGGPGEEH